MTLKQHNEFLKSIGKDIDSIAQLALVNLVADIKERIFVKGLPIGYSTDPLYASKKTFETRSKFQPRGKENKGNFKNGNERKTMYFKDGYKQLRETNNRATSKMNFDFTGSMRLAFQGEYTNQEGLIGFTNEEEREKYDGLVERFGKKGFTLQPTSQELKQHNEYLLKLITNDFNR